MSGAPWSPGWLVLLLQPRGALATLSWLCSVVLGQRQPCTARSE